MATGAVSMCSQLPSQPGLGYSVLVGPFSLLLFCEADETSWVKGGPAVQQQQSLSTNKVLLGTPQGQLVNKHTNSTNPGPNPSDL